MGEQSNCKDGSRGSDVPFHMIYLSDRNKTLAGYLFSGRDIWCFFSFHCWQGGRRGVRSVPDARCDNRTPDLGRTFFQ